MSSFKEKSQIFIMGLMAGLIIAGGFFILKLDDYFKELNFYKTVAKTFHSEPKIDATPLKVVDTAPAKEKKSKEYTVKNSAVSNEDSVETVTSKTEIAIVGDTIKTDQLKDTAIVSNVPAEEIVVRKDELVATKTIEVINLNPLSHANHKDSLLQKVSGIKDDRASSKQYFNIEIWQSPLNYKGYKMTKYKISLYGVLSADALKVYAIDDDIYLKNSSTVYKLENSSDFRAYEHITDENIIAKLK